MRRRRGNSVLRIAGEEGRGLFGDRGCYAINQIFGMQVIQWDSSMRGIGCVTRLNFCADYMAC